MVTLQRHRRLGILVNEAKTESEVQPVTVEFNVKTFPAADIIAAFTAKIVPPYGSTFPGLGGMHIVSAYFLAANPAMLPNSP